ncbi:MAG: hypothetical protein GF311_10600 [Candidatus Lokiarchaeota archaeon]|nr:hypothetical protein [Candidatus Lokiarchaeota archaeon]
MTISNIGYIQDFGKNLGAEIDNYCIEEYSESLEQHFRGLGIYFTDILEHFGEIRGGEIQNHSLNEFGNAFSDYFGWNK